MNELKPAIEVKIQGSVSQKDPILGQGTLEAAPTRRTHLKTKFSFKM